MNYVISLIIALTMSLNANANVLLRFKTPITVHAQYLGDILVITPDIHHWSNIKLDNHPLAGQKISKDQITQWLTQQTGQLNYQWQGKKVATIQHNIQSKRIDLINKAQSALTLHLQKHYHSLEIHAISKPKDSDIPLDKWTIKLPQLNVATKRMCVRLHHDKVSIPIWFTVKAYQKVLVATHQIKNRSEINDRDFILKNREVTPLNHKPYHTIPHHTWLIKTMNKGQILTDYYIANRPQVLKGETVRITVINKGISITTDAIALSDGYLGQHIKMNNPKSNKLFVAVVTDKNQAEIRS